MLDMAARVLVVNRGSSSLKYSVLHSPSPDGSLRRLAAGSVDAHSAKAERTSLRFESEADYTADYVRSMRDELEADGHLDGLDAVGHRIVHGGAAFTEPVVIDDAVEQRIADLSSLAPLHNPPAVAALRALRALLPAIPHVAVFDTAFHATLPARAYTYAIPADLATQHGLRRYGFHGPSVKYVARVAAETLGMPADEVNLIVCHIGNGASVTAVARGASVDTSMGFTPLEGLVMGTRCGDLDPAIAGHLMRNANLATEEVDDILESRSGLLGLCGDSDVREVRRRVAAGDETARLALDVYAYRLRKYIGAYLAVLPSLDAVVFTGGVGEHDAALRADVMDPLRHLSFSLDAALNADAVGPTEPVRIDAGTGPEVLVVPTDEAAEIATQVLGLLGHGRPSGLENGRVQGRGWRGLEGP